MDVSARLTTLTRIGFAARGLIYIVIAWLVIRAGRPEDPSGALQYLAEGGGKLFMMFVAAGFIAYGLWRLIDAIFNTERHPPDAKGLRQRLGAGASGVIHLLLAWQAIRIIEGDRPASGGGQDDAGAALSLLGPDELALPIAGTVLLAVGAFNLVKSAKASFLYHLEPQVAQRNWAKWTGRLGYAARAIVFLISGYFLLRAGFEHRGMQAAGIEQSLAWLDKPWDKLVALGLLAFGLYSLIEARFRILHDVPVREIATGSVRPALH
jgi:hypothetical protein